MAVMFVWRSGRVGVDFATPDGAIQVAHGDLMHLFKIALDRCRLNIAHGYLEVEAVADAKDGRAAVRALLDYQNDVEADLARVTGGAAHAA